MNQIAQTVAPASSRTRIAESPITILATFVFLWTLYQIVAHGAGDVHIDMAEAYAWSLELQAGYYKHPPFWAWVTRAWFLVFPVGDWSAYLFSAVNAATGIFFVSRSAAFFLDDRHLQWSAALLLIFIPAYTFHGMKINANTIHLSIWPAATWAFLSLMHRPVAAKAFVLGLLGSCALLSKYNAVLFLACLFVASVVHPASGFFWRTRMPLFVGLGASPLVIFHGLWLWQNDFLPFHYFSTLRNQSLEVALSGGIKFIAAEVLFALPAILILLYAAYPPRLRRMRLATGSLDLVLVVLALGPLLTSAATCTALQTRCPALWGLQNLYFIPVLALRCLIVADAQALYRRIFRIILVFLGSAVLASPFVAWSGFRSADRASVDPRSEVAKKLTQWWNETYHRPLKIVGGDANYALAASFYSPDHPSYFISFNRRLTPWITDERLAREGALLICNERDEVCETEAHNALADRGEEKTISAIKNLLGQLGHNKDFSFFVIPPARALDATR